MPGKQPAVGPTAQTVADNVKRLREYRNMNYTELSERLQSEAGWSINAVGIRRIESGERRVTPDDLMALALVLGVTPVTLLMPYTAEPTTLVEAAGIPEPIPAVNLWNWLTASRQLSADDEWMAFVVASWPIWMLRDFTEQVQESLRIIGDAKGVWTVNPFIIDEGGTDGDD